MTDRRATLRPRLKHLEAESINWPADFWRDPSAWQALGVLLEAGGPGAMRAAAELAASTPDDGALADLLAVALPRTAHEIDLTPRRVRWAREALNRKAPAWRASPWWSEPSTVVHAAAWLASLALVAEHGLDRIDDENVTPALLARALPAGLAGLAELENLL